MLRRLLPPLLLLTLAIDASAQQPDPNATPTASEAVPAADTPAATNADVAPVDAPTPTMELPPAAEITADVLLRYLQSQAAAEGVACALSTVYRVADRVAVACGASGVWVATVDATDAHLTHVFRQTFGAPVTRLFEGGGRLWAELSTGAAVAFDPHATIAHTIPQPPSDAAAPVPPPRAQSDWDRMMRDNRTAQREGDQWHAEGTARPFITFGTLAGGIILEASAGYRFDAPIHIWGAISPLGIAAGPDGSMTPAAATAFASYDTASFEVGLGLGAQTVNSPSDEFDIDFNPIRPGSGITIAQFARIGALDGLTLTLRTDIVLFHSEFQFANLHVSGQLPLRSETPLWIVMRGGGGITGYAVGEIGLRTRVSGDGPRDSLFITVAVGGVGAFANDVCPGSTTFDRCSATYAGPTLSFGAEWRQ